MGEVFMVKVLPNPTHW